MENWKWEIKEANNYQRCFMAGMKIEQTPFISCVFQPASFTIYHRAALIKFFIPPGLYIPVKEKIEGFVGEKIVRRYGGKLSL